MKKIFFILLVLCAFGLQAQNAINTIIIDGTKDRVDLLEIAYTGYFESQGISNFYIDTRYSNGYKGGTWVKVSYPYLHKSRIVQNSGTMVSKLILELKNESSDIPYSMLIWHYCKDQNNDLVYIADLLIYQIKQRIEVTEEFEDEKFPTDPFLGADNVYFTTNTRYSGANVVGLRNTSLTSYPDVDAKIIGSKIKSFQYNNTTWRPVTYKILGWTDRMHPILAVLVDGLVVSIIAATTYLAGDLISDGNIDWNWNNEGNIALSDKPIILPNDSGEGLIFRIDSPIIGVPSFRQENFGFIKTIQFN